MNHVPISVGVRGRLLVAFLGISAFAVLGAVAALIAFQDVGRLFNKVATERVPASFAALELSRQAERIAATTPLLLYASTRPQRMRIDRELRLSLLELDKRLLQIKGSHPEAEWPSKIGNAVLEMRKAIGFVQVNLDPYDDLEPLDRLAQAESLLQQSRQISAQLSTFVDSLVAEEEADIALAGAEVAATQRNSTIALLVVAVLSLLGSTLIVWLYVNRSIVRRLASLSASMLAIAGGNLKSPLPMDRTEDEIGRMAETLRVFRDSAIENERLSKLKRFLPPQIAGLIISSGDESVLESHRRDVAVLFCDLRGFTAFAETAEPEELMGVLREYHSCLGQLVHKFGGTLERFTGDGMMVLFNDPLPCPEPCAVATKMAMEMRIAVSELLQRHLQSRLGFGVGIAYGYATLGRIGFEDRIDYTAIGSVVNLAARLCDRAGHGEILIDEKVKAAVSDNMATLRLADFVPKGFSRPIAVFNVQH
jgi:class 3 adenylate cyclase